MRWGCGLGGVSAAAIQPLGFEAIVEGAEQGFGLAGAEHDRDMLLALQQEFLGTVGRRVRAGELFDLARRADAEQGFQQLQRFAAQFDAGRGQDRDELRGVVAHEVAHVRHRDILIGSIAAAVATGISMLANLAMFATMFGGGSDDDESPNPLVLMAVALVAPMAAGVMQMALSRSREFEADRLGAELLGDPRPLASALVKLDRSAHRVAMDVSPTQATAYIVNPLTGREAKFSNLFLTHPPTEARVQRFLAGCRHAAVSQ